LLDKNTYMRLRKDIWHVPPASAKAIGHPAPYPWQLAENCIRYFGWVGCVVLDMFAGSGSTAVAAIRLDCKSIMIDREPKYCEMIKERAQLALDDWPYEVTPRQLNQPLGETQDGENVFRKPVLSSLLELVTAADAA
ncbi:MAG: DNA methyltransferase, partial [Pseudomonadota bacterium]